MIRRHVKHRADLRLEAVYRLQLKAAYLRDRDVVFRKLRHLVRKRHADIAYDLRVRVYDFEHLAHERRRRRLAVRAGYRDYRRFAERVRKLDLTPHRNTVRSRRFQKRQVIRHSRADYDQVLLQRFVVGIAPKNRLQLQAVQRRQFVFQLFLGLQVRNGDMRPNLMQQHSRRNAASRHAAHQYIFTVKIHTVPYLPTA